MKEHLDKILAMIALTIIFFGYCYAQKWLEREAEINEFDKIKSLLVYEGK